MALTQNQLQCPYVKKWGSIIWATMEWNNKT